MAGSAVGAEAAKAPKTAAERRRRTLRRWVVLAGVVLVVAIAAAGAVRSPLFSARTIEVEGISRLGRDHVLEIAGISPTTNVFGFDAEESRRRLEAEPWIASATVARSLPSTIRVTIVEHVPVAVVASAGGTMLLAGDGAVLMEASDAKAFGRLPLLEPATDGVADTAALAGAVAAMQPALRRDVELVTGAADGGIELTLRSGAPVAYGGPEDADAKGRVLRAILVWAAGEGHDLASVDIRAPEAPTAELVGGRLLQPEVEATDTAEEPLPPD